MESETFGHRLIEIREISGEGQIHPYEVRSALYFNGGAVLHAGLDERLMKLFEDNIITQATVTTSFVEGRDAHDLRPGYVHMIDTIYPGQDRHLVDSSVCAEAEKTMDFGKALRDHNRLVDMLKDSYVLS